MAAFPGTGRPWKRRGSLAGGKHSFGCFLGLHFQIGKALSVTLPHLIREDFVLRECLQEALDCFSAGPCGITWASRGLQKPQSGPWMWEIWLGPSHTKEIIWPALKSLYELFQSFYPHNVCT